MTTPTPPGGSSESGEAPSEETLRRARAHWEQAGEDLRQARRALGKGDPVQGGFMSLQAAQNALRVPCLLHGHVMPPLHSPAALAALLGAEIPELAALGAPCGALEEAQGLNPFAAQRDTGEEREQAARALEQAEAVLGLIKTYLKNRKRRYFAP